VLTSAEVKQVLQAAGRLDGGRTATPLVLHLLYGSGVRLVEGLRLRVKDLCFERQQVTVRQGKGQRDRVTVLPERLVGPLTGHLEAVRLLHRRDLAEGFGRVRLPDALAQKLPAAPSA
jgi:site-specific recombinase XerD